MRKLIVFNNISLDGYFSGTDGDFSWAHAGSDDAQWNAFVAGNAKADGGGDLIFGRKTYEMMASYWPTPMAAAQQGAVAEGINKTSKVVFSTTLKAAAWQNTRLVTGDLNGAIKAMKLAPGKGMAILGSGNLTAQLAQDGLIDEYHLVVNPVILGRGRTMFEGVTSQLPLRLLRTRAFANGKVLMCYEAKA